MRLEFDVKCLQEYIHNFCVVFSGRKVCANVFGEVTEVMQLNRSTRGLQRRAGAKNTVRTSSRSVFSRAFALASADIASSRVVRTDVSLTPLLAGCRAHESSLSAMRVLEDSKDGRSEVSSSSHPV